MLDLHTRHQAQNHPPAPTAHRAGSRHDPLACESDAVREAWSSQVLTRLISRTSGCTACNVRPVGCTCDYVGEALPVWRIRRLSAHFVRVNDLGADTANWTAKREVWSCRSCKRLFALVRVPEKDERDYLVRTPDDDWPSWDWIAIVAATDRTVGWRGELSGEEKFVL